MARYEHVPIYKTVMEWPWTQRGCGWGAPSCAHRTITVSSCAFCGH